MGQVIKINVKENSLTKEFDYYQNNNNNSEQIISEIPNGLINNSNSIFTSHNYFNPNTLEVFLNGIKQQIINDYNIYNNTIQFIISPLVGESILINYKKI